MTQQSSDLHDADDARLLNMVRAGDAEAFSVLQSRHESAARRLARHLVASPYEVDDVVAEAFAWVLDVTQRGGGPSNAARPYALTVLRRVCYYRLTGRPTWERSDSRALPEPGEPFVEPSMTGIETALIARAYLSLPERWRAVLWHAQVEQARPADVAPLLGLTRNGVLALNRRAIDGLRQAYLQRHLATSVPHECRLVAERLDQFVRDPRATADARTVSGHLDDCDECRAIHAELTDVSSTLRDVVGPLILGSAAEAYLFGPGDTAATAGVTSGRHVAQTAILGSPVTVGGFMAGGPMEGAMRALRGSRSRPRLTRRLTVVAAVAVVAAITLTVTLTASPGTPASAHNTDQPATAAAPPTVSPTVQSSPAPSVSPSAPATSPPAAPPSPAPPVTATISASLDVGNAMFGRGDTVQFQVADTGSAATGPVTVSISLPAGSSAFGGDGGGTGGGTGGGAGPGGQPDSTGATAFGGWSCQPTDGGATCTHAALAAGQQATGMLVVGFTDSSACGQPVSLTATSGAQVAQATQDLSC